MTRTPVYVALSVALALSAACGSSSGDGGGAAGKDGGSGGGAREADGARTCECHVEVNGQAAVIACGSQACVSETVYACDSLAKITRGDACTNDAGSGDGSIPDSGTADGVAPPTCYEQPCTHDSECDLAWKCYALDAFHASACFPYQTAFAGDQSGETCLNDSSRITRLVNCSDGIVAVCVPKICTARGEQPDPHQSRSCY